MRQLTGYKVRSNSTSNIQPSDERLEEAFSSSPEMSAGGNMTTMACQPFAARFPSILEPNLANVRCAADRVLPSISALPVLETPIYGWPSLP